MSASGTPRRAEIVASVLPIGKDRAISTAELCEILHTTVRGVRQEIHDAREAGFLICSCNKGYYMPSDRAELVETYFTLHKKAVGLLAVLKVMRQEISRTADEDQMTVNEKKDACDSAPCLNQYHL